MVTLKGIFLFVFKRHLSESGNHVWDVFLFEILVGLSLVVFFVPVRVKRYLTLLIVLSLGFISSVWAGYVLWHNDPLVISLNIQVLTERPVLVIDPLSAYFLLIVNVITLTSLLYAQGYLKTYSNKSPAFLSLHYFSYVWLFLSMQFVLMLRDGLFFLTAWELMSIASFFLVIFEADKRENLKAGINYLVQMHVGFAFLLVGFLAVYLKTGQLNFHTLANYFASFPNWPIFLIFFVGFGIKAGFIPLHSWLPQAHPAAPSHVSAIMSGVMIKMGIYGILRVLFYLQSDFLVIGLFIFAISFFTGLWGAVMAIVSQDYKKMLAYSSIDNIGLIGLGIGVGILGVALKNPLLSTLGFLGGFAHILNHALFKSLLFYSSGGIYQQTHTRGMDLLGGLIKKMPLTAVFYLVGALALCGLPPLNGFISEFVLYIGLFKSLGQADLMTTVVSLLGILCLILIGGLAAFCFVRAFSVIFLGAARSNQTESSKEVDQSMMVAQLITVVLITAIGLFPVALLSVASRAASGFSFVDQSIIRNLFPTFNRLSMFTCFFISLSTVLLFIRYCRFKKINWTWQPTWGCGDQRVTPRHQYNATTFSDNFAQLSAPLLKTKKEYQPIGEEEIFPHPRKFEISYRDSMEERFLKRPLNLVRDLIWRMAVIQTGKIQHYLFYGLLFIFLIILLTLLRII